MIVGTTLNHVHWYLSIICQKLETLNLLTITTQLLLTSALEIETISALMW